MKPVGDSQQIGRLPPSNKRSTVCLAMHTDWLEMVRENRAIVSAASRLNDPQVAIERRIPNPGAMGSNPVGDITFLMT